MVVDVQAEVHIPEVSEIVSKKVMPAVMSQEQAQEIEKYFFGDADAYYADNGVTKEDLQEEIIDIRPVSYTHLFAKSYRYEKSGDPGVIAT